MIELSDNDIAVLAKSAVEYMIEVNKVFIKIGGEDVDKLTEISLSEYGRFLSAPYIVDLLESASRRFEVSEKSGTRYIKINSGIDKDRIANSWDYKKCLDKLMDNNKSISSFLSYVLPFFIMVSYEKKGEKTNG